MMQSNTVNSDEAMERRRDFCELGGVSVCTCRDRGAVDVKVGTQCSGLGEDIGDLTFEAVVKDRAAEAELVLRVLLPPELVLRVLRMFNSGSCKKASGLL